MAKSSPGSNMKKIASPHRPQFFKVFLPEHSSDHLKIPLAFVHHIGGGGGSLNTVSLKGPGGGVWYTDLVTNSGELFFGKGWKEFISDHSVQFGDFLVFEYAGNMRFNVLVFDHSACEKEASLLARPSGDTFSPKRKRGRQPRKKFNEKQSAKDNSLLKTATPRSILSKKLDKSIETNASVLQARELSMCTTTLEVEKTPPSDFAQYSIHSMAAAKDNSLLKTTPPRSILGKKLDESIETNASVLQARELSMCSTTLEVEKMPPSGEAAKDNSRLKTTTPQSVLGKKPDKSIETNASVLQARELSMCSTTLEVEKMPPSVLFGEKRQNGVISQRRPVTLEEVRGVLQKAKAFKSEHPFGIIQMRDSYVYYSFAMNIPITFAREHLPWPRGNVILWDPSGKRWEVKCIPHGKTRCFSAGWRSFSLANNLETGDCCVFEVIQKYEMKVHILRVVEELTPFISPPRGRIMQPLLEG